MTAQASDMRVAILMAVHASADPLQLEEALTSILIQTHKKLSIYLYCDGPLTPEQNAVLARRLPVDGGHCIVRGQTNRGLPYALNSLIDIALQDPGLAFMARMDADDVSVAERIEQQVRYLLQHPEIDVLGSWCIEFVEPGVPLFHKQLPTDPADVGRFMVLRSPLAHPCVMFRRAVLQAGFRYDPSLLQAQDYELWSRLFCAGYRIANVPSYLLWYRLAKDFYARRAGLSRAWAEFRMRMIFAVRSGQFKPWHLLGFFALFVIRIAPASVKRFSYNYLRRG